MLWTVFPVGGAFVIIALQVVFQVLSIEGDHAFHFIQIQFAGIGYFGPLKVLSTWYKISDVRILTEVVVIMLIFLGLSLFFIIVLVV